MSSSFNTSCNVAANVTFIDLATFAELEAFFYGGPEAITHFVASVQKSNWFSHVPIVLRHQGTFDFGQRNVSAHLNRSGDYVLSVWFRMQLPQVELFGTLNGNSSIRWTRNFMHNLFEKVTISHNELVVHEIDNFWLDFYFQFQLRGSKRVGYRNMIGDIASLTASVGPGVALGTGGFFTCPLPLWFTADSGVALPVAALPFNDIRINYCLRRAQDLLVIDPGVGANPASFADVRVVGTTSTAPSMINPETYAEYVVVHNDERVKMGDAPRDMPIKQTQMVSATPVNTTLGDQGFDLRLSHSIVQFFFVYRNTTVAGEFSNYTTEPNYTGLDPISFSRLQYENTDRIAMGSDYYSLIHPYYFSTAIPDETGYHQWSYGLHPWEFAKPTSSTNFSKLANVRVIHSLSPAARAAAGVTTGTPIDKDGNTITINNASGATVNSPQTFEHVFQAQNWNVVRIANGSLGHPVL